MKYRIKLKSSKWFYLGIISIIIVAFINANLAIFLLLFQIAMNIENFEVVKEK